MPRQVLAVVRLGVRDATSDPSTNRFVFTTTGDGAMVGGSPLTTQIQHFYNTLPTGATRSVQQYLSSEIDSGTNVASVSFYDISAHLDGSPHGSPFDVDHFTVTGAGSVPNLPTGCSAVISYRADYGSDVEFAPGARPRARDRARCYVGPINNVCLTNDSTTNRPALNSTCRTDLLLALKALAQPITGPDSSVWNLGVWSRKNASVKVASLAFIDDRVDYQRRRSDQGPIRQTQAIP